MKYGFEWNTNSLRGVLAGMLVVAVALGLPTFAAAQDDGADETTETEEAAESEEGEDSEDGEESAEADDEPTTEDGLQYLRTANDAFDAGDFETAYENYQQAFEILEEPLVMYRMGETAEELENTPDAIEHYEHYREIGEDEEFLANIDEALPDLREQLPSTLEVVTTPPGATVTVSEPGIPEGTELGATPVSAERAPGAIEIDISMEGYDSESVHIELQPGEERTIERELQAQPDLTHDEPEDRNLGLWGWTSTGLGAAILAFGGVMTFFQFDTTEQVNEFERADHRDAEPEVWEQRREEQRALRSDAESYYRAATGAYIAGGLLTAAGLGILTYNGLGSDSGDAEGSEVGLRFGAGAEGGFIGVAGEF